MKYLFYLFAILLLLTNCGPKHDDEEVKILYDKVIEIHDEVMPKISDISKLRRKIRKQENKGTPSLNIIKQLEDADDAMMTWMTDFQVYKIYKDSTKESKLKYLNGEKIRIQRVSDEMYTAINTAKDYLNEK